MTRFQRIDGGKDRSDYLPLLLGLDSQKIFVLPANYKSRNLARNGKSRTNFLSEINRRSQYSLNHIMKLKKKKVQEY